MEQLLKVGEETAKTGGVDVDRELSDFEKRLQFTQQPTVQFEDVNPKPHFCVKTRHLTIDGGKVFVNICSAPCVPPPPPITDAELKERVEEADESNLTVSYRVPISLGAPRDETDNKGVECRVFDVVVNEQYIDSVTAENAKYQIGFVVSVALQGLEHKYELDLDRNWIMLKNRKSMGTPSPQRIRQKSTNPKLEEFADHEVGGERPERVDVKRVGTNIEARIQMSRVTTAKQIKLEFNRDSFKIIAAPNLYKVRCWLTELQVDSDRAQATFDCATKNLNLTIPIF